MRKKEMDTKIAVFITVLVMLLIGLTIYVVADKVTDHEDKNSVSEKASDSANDAKEESSNKEVTQNEKTDDETSNVSSIPTESDVKKLMTAYIKDSYVDYRINSVSFDNNTKEFKEMIHEDQDHVLAYVDYDVIRDENQGWIKANQAHCILVKDSNGSYYVSKCGSGW